MLSRRHVVLVGALVVSLLLGETAAFAKDGPSTKASVTNVGGQAAKTEVVDRKAKRPSLWRKARPGAPVRSALGGTPRRPVAAARPVEWRKSCLLEHGARLLCSARAFALPSAKPAAHRTTPRPAAVGARELALRAVSLLRLPAPHAEVRPMVRFHDGARGGLTGAPLWLWVPEQGWRTLRQRTEAGTAWAEVTAEPVSQTWTFGDGSRPLTCRNPGTELTRSNVHRALEGSPTCGYTYTVSSKDQPHQQYTLQVTVDWQVSWVGSGDTGGILPMFRLQQSIPYTVRQARAQLVDPDN